ncbi:MAG: metal ABC transporter substrate-binding protein [Candidatus Puniceispirillum sp.]|nr:metal ABC transporter substrate-binding protein [Candidatus Puniceispirillum sp.]
MLKKLKYVGAVALVSFGLGQGALAGALKVGVTAGPHAQIMAHLKERTAKQGLTLDVIEFDDFVLPNTALFEKELDVNSYQHEPYLTEQNQARGMDLVSVGKTIILPLGLYSKTLKKIEDVPYGAKIAIPSDVSNGGRALRLLEKAGILTLKKDAPMSPSVLDIAQNPKHVKLVEVDAPHVPRALDDVDLAAINTDWVLVSGIDPKSALAREDQDSPYANLLVVRKGDEKRPEIVKLVSLYHTQETATFLKKTFHGAVIPAWQTVKANEKAPCAPSQS